LGFVISGILPQAYFNKRDLWSPKTDSSPPLD
jgi:hypothetical protein